MKEKQIKKDYVVKGTKDTAPRVVMSKKMKGQLLNEYRGKGYKGRFKYCREHTAKAHVAIVFGVRKYIPFSQSLLLDDRIMVKAWLYDKYEKEAIARGEEMETDENE